VAGDSEELRKVADTLDDFKAGIVKACQRQTNLSPAEISALMPDHHETDEQKSDCARSG
jgi:hypothetical protein